jgi:hypothetical protein
MIPVRRRLSVVGQVGDGQGHDRVEEREGRALQETHPEIADLEIAPDRLDHQGQDISIDEGEDIRGEQQPEYVVRIRSAVARRRGIRARHQLPVATRSAALPKVTRLETR